MKKARRELRLNGLGFYEVYRIHWLRRKMGGFYYPCSEKYSVVCIDRKYDLRKELNANGRIRNRSDVVLLTGQRLHDKLVYYSEGKLVVYYYDRRKDQFVLYNTLNDLVNDTYKDWLIERLAGL